MINTQGKLTASGAITGLVSGATDNEQGTMASNEALQLNTGTLNNNQGTLSSVQSDAAINSQGMVNNASGKIIAGKALQLSSAQFDNTSGTVKAQTLNLDTRSNSLNNAKGQISANQATISAGALNNDAGLLQAAQSLSINTNGQTLTNTNSGASAGILSGGTLHLHTGVLDNTSGRINSTKELAVYGTDLNNTQGSIATGQDLELTLNSLTNTKGLVTAGNNLNATTSQVLNNDQGLIAGNQTVRLNTQSMSNVHGQIASVQGNTTVNSAGQINNQSGQIAAAQTLSTYSEQLNNQNGQLLGQNVALNSADLNNDVGLIQATQALSIDTHGASLTNTHSGSQAGILSGGSLAIASGDLNNQTGLIAGAGSAQLNTKAANNQQGQISVQSQLDLNSTTINNTDGLIRIGQIGHLKAASIYNNNTQTADKGIEASELHIETTDLDNSGGAVRGNTLLELDAGGHLNNTLGSITAEHVLKIQGHALAITNTEGLLNAGQNNQITANSLTGDGQVLSQQDLSIGLSSNFDNTAKVQAGRDLKLSTTATLFNNSTILAGNLNQIQAQNIDNRVSAQIVGSKTELISQDTLSNRGLIDGNNTYLKANLINNIGTGRVYGDHLSIAASTLNNLDETVAGKNTAATIAARQQLDIGAQTINNREHATLYADGILNVGGALDANRVATGQAAVLNNASATIESTGHMNLAAQSINNTNEHFSLRWIANPISTEHKEEYALAGQAQRYTGGTWDRRSGDKNQQWAYYTTADGQVIPGERWDIWNYDRKTYRQEVASSDPAKIIAGGNLTLSGGTLTNDKSQIIAGGTLSDSGLQAVKQINADAQQRIETEGTYTFSGWSTRWYKLKRRPRRFENTSPYTSVGSNPNVPTINSTFTLPVTAYEQHQTVQGSGLTVGAVNTGNSVQTAASVVSATTPNLSAHNTGATSSITSVQSLNTSDPTLIKSGAVNTQMPNSSLYTVNPNSSEAFIQTDPRFTNYRNWLSSDWMLNALRLDPANMHKRLGDGYYEQKLVREQVAQLTGRRFLTGQTNDDEQYKALMNAGVTFAGQYNLRPGIALTQEQMARLTSDIVWLVEQEVTLPDGHTVTALVPKVYVAVKPGDIDGTGTLISADQIKLNLTGDLNNAGIIAGRNVTQISAENVNNLGGRISADQLSLQARNNLNNVGGTLDAHTRAVLLAGNDMNFTTTTQSSTNGLVDATTVDRVAGLYVGKGASRDSTSLIMQAGNNLNLNAAQISNVGVGTSALLAGNDLNVGTVTQTHREQVSTDANNYRRESSSTDIGSSVQTQSHLMMQAGHNLSAQAASLNSEEGTVQLKADNNIQITEGRTNYELDEAHKIVSRGILSKSTLQTHDTISTNTAISSDVTGKQVVVNAGNDALIRGSNLVSDHLTQVNAGNDVNILSASNTETTSNFKEVKKSGLTGGLSAGVLSVGYGKSQTTGTSDAQSITQSASTIASLKGDTQVVAGKHLQVSASDIAAGKDLTLAGQSVDLVEAQETNKQDSTQTSKSSGFSVGLTVNPVAAFSSAYQSTYKNTPATGTVGKITRLGDAVGAGAKAATTPVVITAGNRKSSTEQHQLSSDARVSTVQAGGKLNILATEGSITSRGTSISSEGDALMLAKDNITLDVAHNYQMQSSDSKASGWSLDNRMTGLPVGVYKNKANGDGATDSVTGTNLSVGGKATLATQQGDISIIGSNAVATGDLNLNAAKKLSIISAQNTAANENHSNNKAIGKVVISDTERFMGYHSEKANNDNQTVTQVSSNVGSLKGNFNATAGDQYTQIASNVVAGNDINVSAKRIDILTAQNTGDAHADQKATKVGVFARVSSPIIDLVNNVEAAGKSDGRLQAMQGMAAAGNAYQAGSAIAQMAGAGYGSGSLLKAEAGIGVASNRSNDNSSYSTSVGNGVKAGNNISFTSTEGDIHLQQTDVSAGNQLKFDSANNLLVESGQSTTHTDGKHSNYGAEIGVGVAVGAQTGVYAYAQANAGKGNYSTDTVTHNNSHLNAQAIEINTRGDATFKGAVAKANTINTDVGGKLIVESVQDTAKQLSKESGVNARAQISFGTAWEVSGGVNAAKGKGDYANVTEQSGLFAGDGGYHVKVKEVELKGGAIASTNPTNSELASNELTFSNIENHNTFSTSSSGINFANTSVAANVIGNLGNVVSMTGTTKPNTETASTLATLTEGKLIIGGKETTAAELSNQTGINTDASKANGSVSEAVDIKALLAEQKAMNAAVQTVTGSAGQLLSDQQKFAQANAQAAAEALDKAKAGGDPALIAQAQAQFDNSITNMRHWGAGGTYNVAVNALAQIVTGIGGDKSPSAIAAVIASPLIANQIGDNISQDNVAGKLVTHALLAGVTAALSGADSKEALSVGLSTGLIESVVTPKLAQELYGTSDPAKLTPEQQQNLLALSGAAGGLLAGIAGDSAQSAVLGTSTALNAVENNYLLYHERVKLEALREQKVKLQQQRANTGDALDRAVLDTQIAQLDGEIKHLEWVDWKTNQDLISACSGPTANAEGCKQESSKFYNTNLSWSSGHSLYDSAVLGLSDQGKRNVYAGYDENERLSHYAKLSPAAASQFSMEQVAGNAVGMSGYAVKSSKSPYIATSAGSKGSFQARDPMTGRNAILENTTSRNMRVIEVSNGTQSMANADFDRMNLSNVRPIESAYGTWGRMGTTEDGLRVIVRPSQDGRPTIQVQRAQANGKLRTVTEVRYGTK